MKGRKWIWGGLASLALACGAAALHAQTGVPVARPVAKPVAVINDRHTISAEQLEVLMQAAGPMPASASPDFGSFARARTSRTEPNR